MMPPPQSNLPSQQKRYHHAGERWDAMIKKSSLNWTQSTTSHRTRSHRQTKVESDTIEDRRNHGAIAVNEPLWCVWFCEPPNAGERAEIVDQHSRRMFFLLTVFLQFHGGMSDHYVTGCKTSQNASRGRSTFQKNVLPPEDSWSGTCVDMGPLRHDYLKGKPMLTLQTGQNASQYFLTDMFDEHIFHGCVVPASRIISSGYIYQIRRDACSYLAR